MTDAYTANKMLTKALRSAASISIDNCCICAVSPTAIGYTPKSILRALTAYIIMPDRQTGYPVLRAFCEWEIRSDIPVVSADGKYNTIWVPRTMHITGIGTGNTGTYVPAWLLTEKLVKLGILKLTERKHNE